MCVAGAPGRRRACARPSRRRTTWPRAPRRRPTRRPRSSRGASPASAQDLDELNRELTDIEGDRDNLTRQPLQASAVRSPTYVEERLTDGELYYRLQDYLRASIIFTDIVDNFPRHRAVCFSNKSYASCKY